MRVVFFGTRGTFSAAALETLLSDHTVIAVVQPAFRRREAIRAALGTVWRGGRSDPVTALARRHRVPRWPMTGPRHEAVRSAVRGAAPDVICIAGFPWILPPGVYQAARLAAINVHPSLLPRHRGLLPLFWVYHADDRETGVTVHRVTERADAGGILEQEGFPLPRGCPVDRLNDRNGMAAGLALRRAVTALAEGVARERSQDERLVTTAPAVQPGTPMVDFAAWDVERVWHFLAGLFPRFIEPLSSDRGPVRYGGVRGFRREVHSRAPGTVAVTRQGPELYCADGVVELDPS